MTTVKLKSDKLIQALSSNADGVMRLINNPVYGGRVKLENGFIVVPESLANSLIAATKGNLDLEKEV